MSFVGLVSGRAREVRSEAISTWLGDVPLDESKDVIG